MTITTNLLFLQTPQQVYTGREEREKERERREVTIYIGLDPDYRWWVLTSVIIAIILASSQSSALIIAFPDLMQVYFPPLPFSFLSFSSTSSSSSLLSFLFFLLAAILPSSSLTLLFLFPSLVLSYPIPIPIPFLSLSSPFTIGTGCRSVGHHVRAASIHDRHCRLGPPYWWRC